MTTTPTFQKEIAYDRDTRDFRATLDGNLIGYFVTYHDAENALDQIAYDQLADGVALSAAQLDGGSDPDACAAEVAAAVAWCTSDAPCAAQQPCAACAEMTQRTQAATYNGCAGCGEIYCECGDDDDDYGDALAEGAMGSYNGRTTIDPPTPEPPHGPQPFPFAVSALLAEADRVMADIHYAAVNLSDRERCPFCCGPHAAERCPLKRRTHQLDLVVRPRHCGNCGGEHHIQSCPEILAALFAPETRPVARWPRAASVAAAVMLWLIVVGCAGDATCSPRNDGSRAAATCVTQ